MAYTPTVLFSNNAATTLASALTIGGSSLSVTTGTGALFPTISGSQYFYVTLEAASDASVFEIVKVTARSSDTFTITRAQDGTAAKAWAASDKVQLRLPSIAIEDLETQLSGYADTVSAATVSDTVYGAGWNGVTTIAPSKNAVYDKIETLVAGSVSDTAYGVGWDGETAVAPSKNAVYDKIETIVSGSVSDTAYAGSWNGVTSIAPSKNAVYDEIELRATKASPTFTGTVTTDVLAVGGATTLTGALAANGGVTLGNGSGDALTINSSAVTCANGINFDSNTLVIDATNNRVGVATASPGTPLDVTGVARATSFTLLSGGGGQITFQDGTTMNSAGLGSASALSATGNADITGDSDNNGVGNINFISGATTVATITPDNETTFNYGVYGKGAGLGHHVDAYGASTSETAANNKTAIDLAIAAAIAGTNGSNTVVFGPGTYATDAIVIPMTTTTAKGINIVGCGSKGAQATVISITAAATGFHFSSDAATEDATTYGSFTLRDISFTGGAISIQIGTADKVYHPRSKFILENVFCETYTSNGIKIINTLEGQMQNVVVRGVEGHTTGDKALYILANNWTADANVAGYVCGDISFYNCEFSGYGAGGAAVADYAIYVEAEAMVGSTYKITRGTAGGLKFTDCHFYHGGTAAAYFTGSGMVQDVAFINCQFDYSAGTTTTNVGIWLDNTDSATAEDYSMWKDFRIIGNYFQTYGKALYIQPASAAIHNVIVKQVTFTNNYVANADAYALSIQSAEDVVISNNVFRHCGSGSASYLVNMAGWNRSFSITGNTHTANRSGTAGSQTPQNSNITSLVSLGASSDHFTVSGNVGQIRDSATNAVNLVVDMNTANGSVYGNIAYTSGLSGTTGYNFFDGTIQTLGTIYAGAFSGPGSAITALNASNISSGTMAVSYLGTGGTYPANSGANITALSASNITAGGTLPALNGAALTSVNAATLLSGTWASPGTIGSTTPTTGKFASTTFNPNSNSTTALAAYAASNYGGGFKLMDGSAEMAFWLESSGTVWYTGFGNSSGFSAKLRLSNDGALGIPDGITAPGTVANWALIYVDSSDGDLKIKFSDGTVKTIVTDA